MDDYQHEPVESRKNKKVKEYYQVNLDMGRIFWIVFILGLVIIGIFVLGFYIGGSNKKGEKVAKGILRETAKVESGKTAEKESSQKSPQISIEDLFSEEKTSAKEEAPPSTERSKNVSEPISELKSSKKTYPSSVSKKTSVSRKNVYRKKSHPASSITAGKYYIQVASFSKMENAVKLKKRLEKNLYKVKILEATVNGKKYYRVRVGPFQSKQVAKNTMISMKRKFGLESPFVVEKKK